MTISQINKNLEDNNTTKYNNENYHNNVQTCNITILDYLKRLVFLLFVYYYCFVFCFASLIEFLLLAIVVSTYKVIAN